MIFRPKAVSELPKLNFATAIAIARTARSLGMKREILVYLARSAWKPQYLTLKLERHK